VDLVIAIDIGPTSEIAKLTEQFMALAVFLVGMIAVGIIVAAYIRRDWGSGRQVGLWTGLIVFVLVLIVELSLELKENPFLAIIWMGVLFIGWGVVLGSALGLETSEQLTADQRAGRRAMLLRLVGGSAGLAVGAYGLGRLFQSQAESGGASQPLSEVALPTPTPLPAATAAATTRDRISPAPDTRLELTPNEDFYRIDINTRPPMLQQESWILETDGLFENPRSLSLEELMAYPPVTQPITLSCISNRVGGDLIGTSNWTGLRLRDLMQDLGLRPEAKELYIEADDGFFESVAMEDIMDPRTLLVYGMNGETLPVEHGFPLRIYIPNRYGMKQPKWITKITAIDEEGAGYWVVRGWSAEARPQIVSVIDTIATEEPTADGRIPIGGIAWAGDRGIQKVEIQVGDGEWVEATLRTPPLSPLTWVQWRYDWQAEPGSHRIQVRATDGTGALQIEAEQGVRPDGATGYHSKSVRI
jgi:DMSO/TMAO reductase YedYZ molybdopterin-dependent catalytic subunit